MLISKIRRLLQFCIFLPQIIANFPMPAIFTIKKQKLDCFCFLFSRYNQILDISSELDIIEV